MNLTESYTVDHDKWNELVDRHGNLYQYSWYVDATAKNWCVIVDEAYSKGIILAYNEVMGTKILYPPVFGRTQLFMAMNTEDRMQAFHMIQTHFKIGTLQLEKPEFNLKVKERKFQVLVKPDLNALAKRMLKKASQAKIEVRELPWQQSFHLIEQELLPKVKSLNSTDLDRLRNLLTQLEKHGLLFTTGIYWNNELHGCMYYVHEKKRTLYLKGAATPEVKEVGGMYLAMMDEVEKTMQKKLPFDFGGSSVPGIKRFFNALGGHDNSYFVFEWNTASRWFNLMRNFAKRVR